LGLRAKDGTSLAPISCKRRDCPVCGPRKDRELARVLVLDAREDCPTHGMTLTTVDPETSAETFSRAVARVFARLRRRYGRQVAYFGMVEHTSGRAAASGGHRRIHQHALLKGLPEDVDVLEVERLVRETWQRATGAKVVEVAELRTPGGALGYLALHHRKPEQAAPAGWRGMVERHSENYFRRPIGELRQEARDELQAEAIAWAKDIPVELAAIEVAATSWELVEVKEALGDRRLIEPIGPPRWKGPDGSDWVMTGAGLMNRHTGELWWSRRG
jgi:hypothetical protein